MALWAMYIEKRVLYSLVLSITGVICTSIVINNEFVLIQKDIIRK